MHCLILLACLALPQVGAAQPSPDVATAKIAKPQIPVRRHAAYATVTPVATVRLWVDVNNPDGLDDLRFEYAVDGKRQGRRRILLHRKQPDRYEGIVTFNLNTLKLKPKQVLSLTVVAGKLRSEPLKFTLADSQTVFDNLAKAHAENHKDVRHLLSQVDVLKRTLESLHASIAAGKPADAKKATRRTAAAIAEMDKLLEQAVETSAFLAQATKDNRVDSNDIDKRTLRHVHDPLVAVRDARLPALSKSFERLRAAKPAEKLAATKQCQTAAAEMRTALARVDQSYLELRSYHEAIRTLRELIREQERAGPGVPR